MLGLIGPNGAGKTTLINATTGLAPLATGSIAFGGRRIDGLPPHRIARAGIARTYQNIRLFGALTCASNLAAGAFGAAARSTGRSSPRCWSAPASPHVDLDRAGGALAVRRSAPARDRAGARGRAAILMLDEPAAGMNPPETARLVETIRAIAATASACC